MVIWFLFSIRKSPVVQLSPVHPVLQVHNPSVYRHVLQLEEQKKEQLLPWYPSMHAIQKDK